MLFIQNQNIYTVSVVRIFFIILYQWNHEHYIQRNNFTTIGLPKKSPGKKLNGETILESPYDTIRYKKKDRPTTVRFKRRIQKRIAICSAYMSTVRPLGAY